MVPWPHTHLGTPVTPGPSSRAAKRPPPSWVLQVPSHQCPSRHAWLLDPVPPAALPKAAGERPTPVWQGPDLSLCGWLPDALGRGGQSKHSICHQGWSPSQATHPKLEARAPAC